MFAWYLETISATCMSHLYIMYIVIAADAAGGC